MLRRSRVHSWGLYYRYETVADLKIGVAIKLSEKLRDEMNGTTDFIKLLQKGKAKKKTVVGGKHIFLSGFGFSLGRPMIKVRKPSGEIEAVDAIGYQFAEGQSRGQSICSYEICSKSQEYETSSKNRR